MYDFTTRWYQKIIIKLHRVHVKSFKIFYFTVFLKYICVERIFFIIYFLTHCFSVSYIHCHPLESDVDYFVSAILTGLLEFCDQIATFRGYI